MGVRNPSRIREATLAALVLGYVVAGALWAVAVPPLEKPDEANHFAHVQYIDDERRMPVQGRLNDVLAEPEAHQPPLYYVVAAIGREATHYAGVPPTDIHDWWPLRNPQFDGNAAKPSRATFWLHDLDDAAALPTHDLLLARLANVLMGVVVVLGTYRIGWVVFDRRHWPALVAAVLVAFLPQFTFITSSISNDPISWAVATAYVVLVLMLIDAPPRSAHRLFAVLGVLMGVALLTKLTLVCLLPLVLLVRPQSITGKQWRQGLTVWALMAIAVSGWWFARNQLLYDDLLGRQERINPESYAWNLARKTLTDPYFQGPFWHEAFTSSIGKFGFLHIRLPAPTYRGAGLVAVAALLGLALHAARLLGGGRVQGQRRHAMHLIALGVLPLSALAALIHYNLTFSQPQGRYLFLALPSVAVLVVLGLDELTASLGNWMGVRPQHEGARAGPGLLTLVAITAVVMLNLYALFGVVSPDYGDAAWSALP